MGGITDTLFGSEGEPARVEDITPSQFRNLRGPTAGALQGILEGGGVPAFEGPMFAPITGTEQNLVDQIGQMAGQRSELTDAARQQMQQTISGANLSPESNPFLAQTIDAASRPIIENFEQDTLPGLRSLFTRSGQQVQNLGSSPFAEALARERVGVANALGDVGTEIAGQNFQAERSRQQQATQAAPQFDRAELDRVVQGLQSVALPRMIEQLGIDRGLEEFRRRQQSLLQAIQAAGSLGSPQTVQTPGTQGSTGLVGGLATGIAGGAGGPIGEGIANALF